MKYLITSRKTVVLDGVLRAPGEIIDGEDLSNPAQLIRRGLAVPLGAATPEQAEASSPSSEPAQTSSPEEGEGEASTDDGDSGDNEAPEDGDTAEADASEVTPEAPAMREGSGPTGSSTAKKKR